MAETEMTAASPAQQTAAPAATEAQAPAPAPAAGAPQGGESTLLSETANAAEAAEAKAPEAAPKEAKPAVQDDPAPEKYADFKDADGKTIPAESLGEFTTVAKELGLSQAKAQKLVSTMKPAVQKYMDSSTEKFGKEWAAEAKADKEYGGDNFAANMGIAAAAYRKFATPELRQMLEATRLGNHPEIIRMFYRIGKAVSPDTGVAGSGAPQAKRRIYPNSGMNL